MTEPAARLMGSVSIVPGVVLDERFKILEILGSGGFATVYLAQQLNITRELAIKVLAISPSWTPKKVKHFHTRFLQEATSAASIDHPDIVTIHDHGVTREGLPFIAMELLNGAPLDDVLLKSGSMAPKRALSLFARCLDALQAAHEVGIVHKDIKPSNIFLRKPGSLVESLVILDFGIATVLDDNSQGARLTTDGYVGTAAYCAPEYYAQKTVSPALDVYQMGLVLVEMFSGAPVVQATTPMHAFMKHCSGELDIPAALLDTALGPIVKRALALEPSDRFENAGDFRDALLSVDPETLPILTSDVSRPPNMVTGLQETLAPDDSVEWVSHTTDPALSRPKTLAPTPTIEEVAEPAPLPAQQPAPPSSSSSWVPWMGVAAVVLVAVGGLALFFSGALDHNAQATSPDLAVVDSEPPTEPSLTPTKAAIKAPEVAEPEKSVPAVAEAVQPSTVNVAFALLPNHATIALVSGKADKASDSLTWSLTPEADVLWEWKATAPRHYEARVRLEANPDKPDAVFVRYGTLKNRAWVWSEPKQNTRVADAPYRISMKLKSLDKVPRVPKTKRTPKNQILD